MLRILSLCTLILLAFGAHAGGARWQMLMVESPGCPFCRQFRAEILPSYAAHPQGRAAPLLHVDFDGPWPNGLALASRPRVTPTFILLEGGKEIGRIEGYPGREAFWPAVAEMLQDAEAR
ncbi:thioredoxin fold domain-containing protein [Paracoccus sp. Z118]|uniref:thioredoxin fold domain-containing protein n=1 Tax=Paracoccus sp. Z118 TaxID=2851017 RepID=UPI0020B88D86|nr:thioredoxin fold domain-containing protein [Paracoccus sp. Z118]